MFGGGRLNGKKLPVTDGEAATFAIALANTGGSGDRAVSLVLVDLTQKAVTKKRIETIDPARKHAELTFSDASAELVGAEGEGWPPGDGTERDNGDARQAQAGGRSGLTHQGPSLPGPQTAPCRC